MVHYYQLDPEIFDRPQLWPLLIDCFAFHLGRLIVGNSELLKPRIWAAQYLEQNLLIDLSVKMQWCFGIPPAGCPTKYLTVRPSSHTAREVDLDRRHNEPYREHWEAFPIMEIDRQPARLVDQVMPLLMAPCTTLVLIDPYIGTQRRSKYMAALAQFLEHLPPAPDRDVQIHTACKARRKGYQREGDEIRIYDELAPRLRNRGNLTVCRWQVEPPTGFHNRYILTDHGGVCLGWGLDAADPNQLDIAVPLSSGFAKQITDRYNPRDRSVLRCDRHTRAAAESAAAS